MTPILLGSLGVAVGLRAGLFNIGVDGQIYLGAIFTTGLAFALAGAVLPMLLPAAGMHAGILLALIAAVVVWLVLQRTVLGFEILATGDNPRAVRVAGIDVRRTMLVALAVLLAESAFRRFAGGRR